MKQYMSINCMLVCILALHATERDPNPADIYKLNRMKRSRSIRPDVSPATLAQQNIAQICCDSSPLSAPDKCADNVVVGSIEMPTFGQLEGYGPGYSYFADAAAGTIEIYFDTLISPVVTATAQDINTLRTIQIIDRTDDSVTLFINDFDNDATIVDFQAIQLID